MQVKEATDVLIREEAWLVLLNFATYDLSKQTEDAGGLSHQNVEVPPKCCRIVFISKIQCK